MASSAQTLRRIQRPLVAAVFLLAGGLFGAHAVRNTSLEAQDTNARAFDAAPVAAGDAGEFEAQRRFNEPNAESGALPTLRFAVLLAAAFHDADAVSRPAIHVAIDEPAGARILHIDAERRVLLGWTDQSLSHSSASDVGGLTRSDEARYLSTTQFPEAGVEPMPVPCAFALLLEASPRLARCILLGEAVPTVDLRWGPTVVLDGVPNQLLEGDTNDLHVRAWIRPGFAYPLLLSIQVDGAKTIDTLRLARFAPGDGPASTIAAGRSPPLRFAQRQAWGPDDADSGATFSLSAAFQAARQDATYASLRNFLIDHPTAAVVEARSATPSQADSGLWTRSWRFTVSDGRSSLQVCTTRTEHPAIPSLMRESSRTCNDAQPRRLDPACLPTTLPSIGAFLGRWRIFTGIESHEPVWSFQWAGDAQRCTGRLVVSVGAAENHAHPVTDPAAPYDWFDAESESRVLSSDTDGRALLLRYASYERDVGPAALREVPTMPTEPAFAGVAPVLAPWNPLSLGVAALAVGLVAALWGLLGRLDRKLALVHPARARILAILRDEPGLHWRALARRAGLAAGQVQHHLVVLRRHDLVTAEAGPRFTCYFPTGAVDRRIMAAAPVLKSDGARRVLRAVADRSGATLSQIALASDCYPSAVHYHASRLEEVGLLERRRVAGRIELHATALTRRAMEP